MGRPPPLLQIAALEGQRRRQNIAILSPSGSFTVSRRDRCPAGIASRSWNPSGRLFRVSGPPLTTSQFDRLKKMRSLLVKFWSSFGQVLVKFWSSFLIAKTVDEGAHENVRPRMLGIHDPASLRKLEQCVLPSRQCDQSKLFRGLQTDRPFRARASFRRVSLKKSTSLEG